MSGEACACGAQVGEAHAADCPHIVRAMAGDDVAVLDPAQVLEAESAHLEAADRQLEELERERLEEEKNLRVALEGKFGRFGFVVMPSDAKPPILTLPVRRSLHFWLYEIREAKALRAVGAPPRTRVLLSGPPGCGKTTLAHHVASRLGLPMVVVQSHQLISKWLGQTGENIGELFRLARKNASGLSLFFDEFDAIAKSREQLGGQGADTERANMTNALLQEFDRFSGQLFAATNVVKGIDPAIWRRFEMQIEIGMPGEDERSAIFRLYMLPFVPEEETVLAFSPALAGASPSLIEDCCKFLKRSLVLLPKMNLPVGLEDMLRQMIATVRPPDELPEVAPLWGNASPTIRDMADVPWPPRKGA